ncbi:Chorismate mutase I [Rhodopirellula islandica]|uniref:Bifunctional chorismate mutase/prephenate dehydratase n=1 Tax=Rhodopirellula islandica TaxID=595434 RepID=A0A0J1B4U3_RHOIS|nr:prephenate dehydratase [Rhodopirellula islandica]KLU01476.1 Chorismate mutase I [Rhodopirellula islandica]
MSSPESRNPTESIDTQILELLRERCRVMTQQAASNAESDWAGTLASIDRLVSQKEADEAAANPTICPEDQRSVLRHVASACWRATRPGTFAFLGPTDSYSHLAALAYFGEAANLLPVPSIGAVFDAVERGDCAGGIAPIENSTDGRVVDTFGRLSKGKVSITGEVQLAIHHQLLAMCDRDAITEVHSKPQAISQCRAWLANHLPTAKLIECSSTAAAAKLAVTQPGVAAIASEAAGRRHGLRVIGANIEDNRDNITRFAVLGHNQPTATGNDKTTLLFQVAHQPGTLADAMGIFKQHELNLTWIESFPQPGTKNEYFFVVEFPGHREDPAVAKAIEHLKTATHHTHVLGSYRRAARAES